MGREYYHGSPNYFTEFSATAPKINRGSNPDGIYLTDSERVAESFLRDGHGYIYVCDANIAAAKIFFYGITTITDRFVNAYRDAILAHTTYKRDWIDDNFIPLLLETGRIRSEFSGELKRDTYVNAGYDALLFPDMFGKSLVVFDPANVRILRIKKV